MFSFLIANPIIGSLLVGALGIFLGSKLKSLWVAVLIGLMFVVAVLPLTGADACREAALLVCIAIWWFAALFALTLSVAYIVKAARRSGTTVQDVKGVFFD